MFANIFTHEFKGTIMIIMIAVMLLLVGIIYLYSSEYPFVRRTGVALTIAVALLQGVDGMLGWVISFVILFVAIIALIWGFISNSKSQPLQGLIISPIPEAEKSEMTFWPKRTEDDIVIPPWLLFLLAAVFAESIAHEMGYSIADSAFWKWMASLIGLSS